MKKREGLLWAKSATCVLSFWSKSETISLLGAAHHPTPPFANKLPVTKGGGVGEGGGTKETKLEGEEEEEERRRGDWKIFAVSQSEETKFKVINNDWDKNFPIDMNRHTVVKKSVKPIYLQMQAGSETQIVGLIITYSDAVVMEIRCVHHIDEKDCTARFATGALWEFPD